MLRDVQLTTTRADHIRATARANEAETLARLLETQQDDGK